MKKPIFLVMLFFSILVLVSCKNSSQAYSKNQDTLGTSEKSKVAGKTVEYKKSKTATLFIHGSSGTINSFGSLIRRIEKTGIANHELVLTVSPSGQITETGEWTNSNNNPLVQVIFEDNLNDEWTQSEWIKEVLLYLQTNYHVKSVNLVGHSMGGVSSLRYLMVYGKDETLPKVEKFIAIGAPFNEFEEYVDNRSVTSIDQDGVTLKSSRYLEYEANISSYPTDVEMLNIAGMFTGKGASDGVVPEASVASIGHLIRSTGAKYTFKEVSGPKSQHSMLHENPQVDQLLIDFLWKKQIN